MNPESLSRRFQTFGYGLHQLLVGGDEFCRFLILNRFVSDDSFQHRYAAAVIDGSNVPAVGDVQFCQGIFQAVPQCFNSLGNINKTARWIDAFFDLMQKVVVFFRVVEKGS